MTSPMLMLGIIPGEEDRQVSSWRRSCITPLEEKRL
jgi:hypothetical protein